MKMVKDLQKNDEMTQLLKQQNSNQPMDTDTASRMIRNLPEYQEKMSKFNSHVELCTQCFSKTKEWSLNSVYYEFRIKMF